MASSDEDDMKIDKIEAEIRKALSETITDTLHHIAASHSTSELELKLDLIDYFSKHEPYSPQDDDASSN